MTLDDCGIPYTAVSSVLLQTRVKAHLVTAIQAYREKSTRVLTGWQSRHLPKHTREQARETLRWMLDHDLVDKNVEAKTFDLVEPQGKERISIPSALNYSRLSMAQIRMLITFLDTIKGTHFHEFKVVFTRKQFAAMVGISVRSLQETLKELVAMRLFDVVDKIENPGAKGGNNWKMTITMLDPRPVWKGWSLKQVGDAYRQEKEHRTTVPVHDRYEYLLASYQPEKDPFPREPVDDYKMFCPFGPHGKKPTMTICSKTTDSWVCAHKGCRKGGNSLLLWARLMPYVAAGGPEKLQRYLKRLPTIADEPDDPPKPIELEPMDQSIDAIFEGDAICQ